MSKIKVLFHSNYSRLKTGFGKNMRNVLLALHKDPDIEVIEASNGIVFGSDPKTPWRAYGTGTKDPEILEFLKQDPSRMKIAAYGFYGIDDVIKEAKPDVYIGIEDIWGFTGFIENKEWWNKIPKIIWTTLDSSPIIDGAYRMSNACEKFLVWASFSEKEMKENGCKNVETLHGAVDLKNFYKIDNQIELKKKFGLEDNFVIGFVCKNQLRKSIPNLLEGFNLLLKKRPDLNAKLLIHTDWGDSESGWDIPVLIKEKGIDPNRVLSCYSCSSCSGFTIEPYKDLEKQCPFCKEEKTLRPKTILHGLNETQLNQIYNLMDVYCHPFTSGGQEIPIQEAKAAGLITLVTEYSCGTDSCYPEQGGLPLKWSEYREPVSQFIKASTCPISICEQLEKVANMTEEEKKELTNNGRKNVEENFSVEAVVKKLKSFILETAKTPVVQVEQKKKKQEKSILFKSLLDKEKKDRILIVLPEEEEDIFLFTSILPDLKRKYKDKDIYFATKQEFFPILIGNPYLYKLLEFHPQMENIQLMEGYENHEGYFEVCYLPHINTQKFPDYSHNSKDKKSFNLRCTY